MDLIEHEKLCIRKLGKPFTEVHVFLDSFSRKYKGFSHRILLHHKLGVNLCVKKFGEQSRSAAILHIQQDLGFLPRSWKDLEAYNFPLEGEDLEQEKDLKKLYGEKVYEEVENENENN